MNKYENLGDMFNHSFNIYTPISTPYIQLYFIYQIVMMNFDTASVVYRLEC
jgi:flagellar biosynthesis regulator FlbT